MSSKHSVVWRCAVSFKASVKAIVRASAKKEILTLCLAPDLEALSTDTQPESSSNTAESQDRTRTKVYSELPAVRREDEGTPWPCCHQAPAVRRDDSGEEPFPRQMSKVITCVVRRNEEDRSCVSDTTCEGASRRRQRKTIRKRKVSR